MRRNRNHYICEPTGKVKYKTEQEAEAKLMHTQELRGRGGAKRVYQCMHCSSYHLTSRDELSATPYKPANLKYVDRWIKLMNEIKQTDNAKLEPTTIQTHKRDKKRPVTGIPGCTVITLHDRLYFEVSNDSKRVAREEQLPSTALRVDGKRSVRSAGKSGKKRH